MSDRDRAYRRFTSSALFGYMRIRALERDDWNGWGCGRELPEGTGGVVQVEFPRDLERTQVNMLIAACHACGGR